MKIKNEYVNKVFDLAKISLAFAKINRATHHEDGIRRESDTDHTFMLSLISCSLADTFYKKDLNTGLVSQFALIHDLVEVYAGDTNSFINFSKELREEKQKRELLSFQKIKDEINPEFPFSTDLIARYEKQEEKEARFVKFVDKIMPELSHIITNFSYINNSGTSRDYFYSFIKNKSLDLNEKYNKDFPEVFDLYKMILEIMFNKYEKLN